MDSHDLALAVIAPVLAIIVAIAYLILAARRKGAMNMSLRFLGLSLHINTCTRTEFECEAMRNTIHKTT